MKPLTALLVSGGLAIVGFSYLHNGPTSAPSNGSMGKIGTRPGNVGHGTALKAAAGHELACFSSGCFWGSENTFRHVKGVVSTAVGYTGGTLENPTYEQVCTHTTGHAESVLVEFDPKVISYAQLLRDFWKTHDPTTPDQQGPDFGTNYRSAIWTFGDDQMKTAQDSVKEAQKTFKDPITTQIAPIGKFWLAEGYHQQYDEKNGTDACPGVLLGGG
jgi:peptide-methionine (S)-S-oxide reductase